MGVRDGWYFSFETVVVLPRNVKFITKVDMLCSQRLNANIVNFLSGCWCYSWKSDVHSLWSRSYCPAVWERRTAAKGKSALTIKRSNTFCQESAFRFRSKLTFQLKPSFVFIAPTEKAKLVTVGLFTRFAVWSLFWL